MYVIYSLKLKTTIRLIKKHRSHTKFVSIQYILHFLHDRSFIVLFADFCMNVFIFSINTGKQLRLMQKESFMLHAKQNPVHAWALKTKHPEHASGLTSPQPPSSG